VHGTSPDHYRELIMNGKCMLVAGAAAVVIYILLSCEGAGCEPVPPVEQTGSLFDQFLNLWELG
jgi:hypothetical protein